MRGWKRCSRAASIRTKTHAQARTPRGWPGRAEVRQFAAEADRRVHRRARRRPTSTSPAHPLLHRAEAVFAILEHEAMHQETLLYMWHRLPFDQKRVRTPTGRACDGAAPRAGMDDVPAGRATLGVDAAVLRVFAGTTSGPGCVDLVDAFRHPRHDVTNAAFLEFVEAGGYRR